MYCVICNRRFDFDKKGSGVSYRNKPICDECLLELIFVGVDKFKEPIRKRIKQEIQLERYREE